MRYHIYCSEIGFLILVGAAFGSRIAQMKLGTFCAVGLSIFKINARV
jgi:hypothetical protein